MFYLVAVGGCVSSVEKALLISDVHFDSADNDLVELVVFKFGKWLNPDIIFLNGDIIDNYAISRWGTHPAINKSLKQDLGVTKDFLQKLRRAFPDAKIVYVFGNHEHRLETYLTENAPELFPFVNLQELLELDKLNIECIRSIHRENWYRYHDIYIGHFDKAAGNAASTAQALIRERGVSLIQGHVHKCGMTAKRFLDRTLYAYENPCLADMDAPYVKSPNWMQGFTVIYQIAGETHVYVVPIKNGRFVFSGEIFEK